MKNEKPNAELAWKQLDDLIVPRLRLSLIDRTVYANLLRQNFPIWNTRYPVS